MLARGMVDRELIPPSGGDDRPAPVPSVFAETAASALGLRFPQALISVYADPPGGTSALLYRPDRDVSDPGSLAAALRALATAARPAPPNLVPLAAVDDRSLAVVVCSREGAAEVPGEGAVLRWHLDSVPEHHQGAVLDLDARTYLVSRAEEDAAREEGLCRMSERAEIYRREYVEPGRQPKPHIVRPVQLACQNVIVGLAAFAYASAYDGLAVPLWQTCEVPHVAANEGARALAALMLCDAFRTGGTMEIRFPGHPEGRVPTALRRYARTVGVALEGAEHGVITPAESRALFLAVTALPDGLAERAREAFALGVVSPERLCYALAAGTWSAPAVDVLLAAGARAGTVLSGGSDHRARHDRAVEGELCRAALMTGMLHARLDVIDGAGAGGEVRVFEDDRRGVGWTVVPEAAAVHFTGVSGPLPWTPGGATASVGETGLLVLPRSHPTVDDVRLAHRLNDLTDALVALVVPADQTATVSCDLPVLRCPDTVADLDATVERALLDSRVTRS